MLAAQQQATKRQRGTAFLYERKTKRWYHKHLNCSCLKLNLKYSTCIMLISLQL